MCGYTQPSEQSVLGQRGDFMNEQRDPDGKADL